MFASLLIVSAVVFEAAPTLKMLGEKKIPYEYLEIGIGPLNAAKSSQKVAALSKGRHVIYIGSAGTFGDFKEPFLVTVNDIRWLPTGERMGFAKFMKDLHKPVAIEPTGNFDLPEKTVITSTSVSLDSTCAVDELPDPDDLIENMEAYSIADELVGSADSIDIIFGITNGVGPEGSKDWVKNFKNIAQMTADYLESVILKKTRT